MAPSFKVKITTLIGTICLIAVLNVISISYETRRRRNIDDLLSPNATDASYTSDTGNDTMEGMFDDFEIENNSSGSGTNEIEKGEETNGKTEAIGETTEISIANEDPLKVALMRLHPSQPAGNASEISHIGIFKHQFGH